MPSTEQHGDATNVWGRNPFQSSSLLLATRGPIASLVLRRLLWTIPVLFFVVLVTFALMHLAPGSPWDQSYGDQGPKLQLSETAIERLNAKYGLDRPWWQQVFVYLRNVVTFDFGDSYRFQGQQASALISERLSPTFTLAGIAVLVILPVGVGLGVLAALRHNSRLDYAITGLATLAASVPNFVVGIFLILFLSVGLNRATDGSIYLPSGGFGLDQRLVMPLITLSLLPIAFVARLMRASTLDTLRQDHVRTAQAKGLRRKRVVAGHVVKNALVPVVTTMGPLFVFLISGTVIIESLFQVPGLGGAFVQAVGARDYPVILAATIVYTVVVVVANLVVDVVYLLLDPRMRPG